MAVRRERVILELEDQFTGPLARAAAATKTFEKSLDDLDRTAVRTDRDMAPLGRPDGPIGSTGRQAGGSSREIDRFSGRLRLLADTAAILGPALVPIGAVAIPAVTGLAAQFGAAALAGGTALLAFQGVGEALEAVNKAALEPTTANLEAAQIAMGNLAPEAQAFVRQLQEMRPAFSALRDAAAAGIFPGLSEALTTAEGSFDRIEAVLYAVGDAAGEVAAEFAEGLAGPRGQEFLSFLEAEIPSALSELGRSVGNIVAGMGELWMAFTPLNRDFSGWLLDVSRGFDDWATGLAQTEGFRDFVAYVRENGPRVADAMGSIGSALLQIVEAAAPMGGPVLAGLTAVADAIGAIADSGAGPAIMASVTALALLSRGMAAVDAIKGSALFAGIGDSADGAARKMNTMQRATVGLASGLAALAVVDAAQGGFQDYTIGVEAMTGAILDMQEAASGGMSAALPEQLDGIGNAIDRLANPGRAEALQDSISNALGGIGNEEEYDRARAQIESLDAALTGLVQQGQSGKAEDFLSGLGLNEGQMRDLMGLLPGYKDALAGVENQSRLTGEAGKKAGDDSARGMRRATSAAEEFRRAIERANAVLEGRASMRDYEQAIDDLRKSIRDNGRTLDINTEKGRNNQAALDAIASTALKVSENMRGTNRVNFLNNARRDFVDAAQKMGIGEQRARELWNRLTQLDKTRANPKVDIDTGAAMTGLNNLEQRLNNIADEDVFVNVRHTTTYSSRGRGPVGGVADGGMLWQGRAIRRAAAGEMVPDTGLGYADRHLYLLADREHIVSNRNGQADKNRAALEAANRGAKLAVVGALAGGGMAGAQVNVGAPSVNVGSPSVRVFIDGNEVRAIVRSEQAKADDFDRWMSRG